MGDRIRMKFWTIVLCMFGILFVTSNTVLARPTVEELAPEGWVEFQKEIELKTLRVGLTKDIGLKAMYYQTKFFSEEEYKNYTDKKEQIEEEKTKEYEKVKKLQNEMNSAYDEYRAELMSNPPSANLAELEEAFKAARKAYEEGKKDYEDFCNIKRGELIQKVPDYVEADWLEDEQLFKIFTGKRKGEVHLVVWVKLVTADKTYYDYNVYTTYAVGSSEVSLEDSEITLKVGESRELQAYISGGLNGIYDVEWSSSNPEVAEVDDEGNVTAKSEGTADVTISVIDGSSDSSATCHVIVGDKKDDGNKDDKKDDKDTNKNNIIINNHTIPNNVMANNQMIGIIQDFNRTGNMDDTKATGKIPQTGAQYNALLIMIGLGIVSLFGFYQYRKYKF